MISGLHKKIRGWMKLCADICDWEGHWCRYCKRYFRRGQRGEGKRCAAKVASCFRTASGQVQPSRPLLRSCSGKSAYPPITDSIDTAVRISGLCHFETWIIGGAVRGLLRLYSRYGPSDCSATQGDLCHEASAQTLHNRAARQLPYRQLSGWNPPPLVIRAVRAHCHVRTHLDTDHQTPCAFRAHLATGRANEIAATHLERPGSLQCRLTWNCRLATRGR
jgi:hypothetical protein